MVSGSWNKQYIAIIEAIGDFLSEHFPDKSISLLHVKGDSWKETEKWKIDAKTPKIIILTIK